MISLRLQIDNVYDDGTVTTTATVEVPPPPEDEDERSDWEDDHIFPATGTGQAEGDAGYFVTVTASSQSDLIPVGTEFEFGT